MSELLPSGVVLGFGGSNARYGVLQHGEIYDFNAIPTPKRPKQFFAWIARQVLQAADAGHEWLVAGFPGPVKPDGSTIGPMRNVSGLSKKRFSMDTQLTAADTAVGRLLKDGFMLLAVNDGELAAQAAATRIGEHRYNKTAALIVGTGVGAGVVIRDSLYSEVYRADRSNPTEIGHIVLSANPGDTFENRISGPALEQEYGGNSKYFPADHPAWKRVGETVGQMTTLLGVMNGVELVVPCGGVGSGGFANYKPYLDEMIAHYRTGGNATQKLFLPEIIPVPQQDAQVFELYGGEGVVRDFTTRRVLQAA